ncbi:MAG: IS5 family transposase [Chloroflexi bacterium]|nr:IS5 family transposase [Chloroflexota bacterium]
MRGDATFQTTMLSLVTTDDFIPDDHPIRRIKPVVERALSRLSPVFEQMYSHRGRPSIPPEHLLKGSLLIALYSIRSERQFCERLRYDLLFKWFLDLNIEDEAFDASTFSKNKQRLLEHDVARLFFEAVLSEARRKRLLSPDHFTVDGTLLESWASIKSFRPRDGNGPPSGEGRNPDVDFHGESRSNATHASATDPEARLARKGPGKEAKLSFAGHVLMENRNGLVVDLALTQATGTAEREAALEMLGRLEGGNRATVGADKGYDTKDFVTGCRERAVSPHVARKRRHSAIDGRTVRHTGYAASQRVRKRVEEIFGWMKTVGGGRKLRYIGLERNFMWAALTSTAYNLVRMAKLMPISA